METGKGQGWQECVPLQQHECHQREGQLSPCTVLKKKNSMAKRTRVDLHVLDQKGGQDWLRV